MPLCVCHYVCVHACAWWSMCAPTFPPLSLVFTCSTYIALAKCSTTVLATALFDLPYFLGGRDISSSLIRRLSCLLAAEVPWSDVHARRPWSSVTPHLVHRCAKMHSFPYGQPLSAVLNSLHTALLGLLAACFCCPSHLRAQLDACPSPSIALSPLLLRCQTDLPLVSVLVGTPHTATGLPTSKPCPLRPLVPCGTGCHTPAMPAGRTLFGRGAEPCGGAPPCSAPSLALSLTVPPYRVRSSGPTS